MVTVPVFIACSSIFGEMPRSLCSPQFVCLHDHLDIYNKWIFMKFLKGDVLRENTIRFWRWTGSQYASNIKLACITGQLKCCDWHALRATWSAVHVVYWVMQQQTDRHWDKFVLWRPQVLSKLQIQYTFFSFFLSHLGWHMLPLHPSNNSEFI